MYRNRKGTGTGNFSYFWWYRNRYRKNLVPEKSLGTGIGKIEYRKKVSEPVSRKFGTEKSIGIGIAQHFGYRHTLPLEGDALFPCLAHEWLQGLLG